MSEGEGGRVLLEAVLRLLFTGSSKAGSCPRPPTNPSTSSSSSSQFSSSLGSSDCLPVKTSRGTCPRSGSAIASNSRKTAWFAREDHPGGSTPHDFFQLERPAFGCIREDIGGANKLGLWCTKTVVVCDPCREELREGDPRPPMSMSEASSW